MDLQAFSSLLKEEAALAERALLRADEAVRAGDEQAFEEALCECIRHKFLLERTPLPGDDLLRLSEESTARTLTLAEGNLKAADVSSGCVEADTAETKKILLALMLRKRFELTFPPERIAETDTVHELCQLLRTEMNFPSCVR